MKTKSFKSPKRSEPSAKRRFAEARLLAAITDIGRQIFALRQNHSISIRTQACLDAAREQLHFAKVNAAWDANGG